MGGSSAGSSGSADAPTTKRSTVTQVRKSTGQKVVDFVKGGGFMGMAVRTVKGAIDKRNPRSNINDPTGLYAEGLTTGSRNNNNTSGGNGGNDNPIPVATNVGGKIIIAPSTAEVSQSNATDVTYDSRKTKAKGRSMTILTSSKGVRKDDQAVLGNKSLLGRA